MDLTWKLTAACRLVSTDLFYPMSESDAGLAKAVCGSCQVQQQCLEYAITVREPEGIWGGHTFAERRSIIRQRRDRARVAISA